MRPSSGLPTSRELSAARSAVSSQVEQRLAELSPIEPARRRERDRTRGRELSPVGRRSGSPVRRRSANSGGSARRRSVCRSRIVGRRPPGNRARLQRGGLHEARDRRVPGRQARRQPERRQPAAAATRARARRPLSREPADRCRLRRPVSCIGLFSEQVSTRETTLPERRRSILRADAWRSRPLTPSTGAPPASDARDACKQCARGSRPATALPPPKPPAALHARRSGHAQAVAGSPRTLSEFRGRVDPQRRRLRPRRFYVVAIAWRRVGHSPRRSGAAADGPPAHRPRHRRCW